MLAYASLTSPRLVRPAVISSISSWACPGFTWKKAQYSVTGPLFLPFRGTLAGVAGCVVSTVTSFSEPINTPVELFAAQGEG